MISRFYGSVNESWVNMATDVAGEFKKIYASSFFYNEKGVAIWPAQVVNYSAVCLHTSCAKNTAPQLRIHIVLFHKGGNGDLQNLFGVGKVLGCFRESTLFR